jgi:hypothetical protein
MKNSVFGLALAAALASPCLFASLTPAQALPVTWDFINPSSNPGPGLVGSTETFLDTSGNYSITAYGIKWAFYLPTAPSVGSTITTSSTPYFTDMYVKNGGAGENGLGLNNDSTGDHEITRHNMIEIVTNPNVGLYQFQMGSTTNGEGWDVYGSNSSAATGAAVLTSLYSDGIDQSLHALSGYTYYYFTYDGAVVDCGQGDNVLLNFIVGQTSRQSTTPLPAALPLFVSGLGGLALFNLRRKRKPAVAIS